MSDSLINAALTGLNSINWPLVRLSRYRRLEAAFYEINAQLKSTRQNASGLVAEYDLLEAHKNKFVAQNFELRAALEKANNELAQYKDNARSEQADRQCGQGGG